jgi:hypothetical protein
VASAELPRNRMLVDDHASVRSEGAHLCSKALRVQVRVRHREVGGHRAHPHADVWAFGRLVTRVGAMTLAVVARLIYQTLLARMSAGH